jgi:hypothetical protein
MRINLKIINPIEDEQWNYPAIQHSQNCFFHSLNWAKVINESYHYKPTYFIATHQKKLECWIPMMEIESCFTGKRGVSLPFSDCCAPIISNEEIFKDIFDQIVSFGEKAGWKYIEFRGGENLFNSSPHYASYHIYTIDLTQSDKNLFSSFRKSTQRNIKKAYKEDVQIRFHYSLKSMKQFYHLHCITRKRHGLIPQPFTFFKNIYNYIISSGNGCIVLATHDNNVIASAVFFQHDDKVIYKYGASDKAYQHLRANNLVMWKAIKFYAENVKYKLFCMGRTELDNTGLKQFKVGWGTKQQNLFYYKYDIAKQMFVTRDSENFCIYGGMSKNYTQILRRMPIPFLRMCGSLVYRHIG